MLKLIKFKSNKEYIDHQLKKTLDTNIIESHKRDRNKRINEFMWKFRTIIDVPRNSRILCIGSRYGEEVEALNLIGFEDVVGIDLMEYAPYTIKMDMHHLEFNDNSFDIIYTNSLDHSNNIKKAISEILRVINKKFGTIMIDIELYNNHGEYEMVEFESIHDVKNIIDSFGIKYGFRDMQFIRHVDSIAPYCIDNSKHLLMFHFNIKDDE